MLDAQAASSTKYSLTVKVNFKTLQSENNRTLYQMHSEKFL